MKRYGIADYSEGIFWAIMSLLLSMFIAGGSWVMVIGLLGGLLLVIGAMYFYRGLVLILLVATPSFFVIINTFLKAKGVPVITAERGLLIFLLLIIFAKVCSGLYKVPKFSMLEKLMILLLVIVFLSYLSTFSYRSNYDLYQGAVLYFEAFITPFSAYLIARTLVWDEDQLKLFIWCISLLGGYLAIVAIGQYFFDFLYLTPTYLLVGEDTGRATSGFGSPVHFGQVMAAILVLTLFLYTIISKPPLKALLLVLMVFIFIGEGLSLTRASWLAMLVALAWIYIKDKKIRPLFTIGIVVGTLALVSIGPFLINWDILFTRALDISPIYNRFALWTTAGNMFLDNIIFGIGFGFNAFNDLKREYLFAIGPAALGKYALEPGVPHNEFLHILVMTGITGFISYILVYINAWKLCVKNIIKNNDGDNLSSRFSVYAQAILIIFFVSAMFADMWVYSYFLTLMFFILGVVANLNTKNRVLYER